MTRGFDDLTLTFIKVKLCDHEKDSFLTLFGCGVKIHKINPIFGYRVKKIPDINPIYGLIELS